jgi:hypothetical protein
METTPSAPPAELGFQLPTTTLNQLFKKYIAYSMTGVPILYILVPDIHFLIIVFTILIVMSAIGAAYLLNKRHHWVYLSTEGIRGIGQTGRKIMIPWNEEITIQSSFSSHLHGIEIRSKQNNNLLQSKLLCFFIPNAILARDDFRATLRQSAPSKHPLLAHIEQMPPTP